MTALMSVSIIVIGAETSLDDGDPYLWIGEDGLGMPPVTRFAEAGALQHGDSDQGFLLQPRIANLVVEIWAATAAEMWNYRNALIGKFAPYNSPILKIVLPNGNTRYLDCHFLSNMDMASADRNFIVQKVAIRVKANDPTFYDPTAVALTFSIAGGSGSFTVPTDVPTAIGASTIDQTTAVTYSGDWYSHPQIRVTGPITDCVITNDVTDEILDFTGTTIAAGDYYDIDTRYGSKSVTDSAGVNKIADLSDDSDLATFHLEPVGNSTPTGINSIRVTGSSVNTNTDVLMTYYNRFLGI